MKINWKNVWSDFEKWHDKNSRLKCDRCHQFRRDLMPEWEEQMKAIQRFVDKNIRP